MSTQTPAGQPAKRRPSPEAVSYTVPEIAALHRIARNKILHYIKTHQLVAYNLASDPHGKRPRWIIMHSDWQDFMESRRAVAPSPQPTRRRKADVPSYV